MRVIADNVPHGGTVHRHPPGRVARPVARRQPWSRDRTQVRRSTVEQW